MLAKIVDNYYIVTGSLAKNPEIKFVGEKQTPLAKLSIIAGKKQDTTTMFVNCDAWSDLATAAMDLKKRDAVCGVGRLQSREHNGKAYNSLRLEWFNAVGKANKGPAAAPAPPGPELNGAIEIEDDDLPF